jgi:hypothetical protein
MSPLFTKIKGSLMIFFVKFFKATKDERLEAYLTDEDRKLLQERVLIATWYPAETARRLVQALFEVVGNKDPQAPRQWGRFAALNIVPVAYDSFLRPGDTFETLKNFGKIFPSFVDSPWFKISEERPGYLEAYYLDPGDDPIYIPFAFMMAGWIEGLIELAGGKETRFEVGWEDREGRKALVYRGYYRA